VQNFDAWLYIILGTTVRDVTSNASMARLAGYRVFKMYIFHQGVRSGRAALSTAFHTRHCRTFFAARCADAIVLATGDFTDLAYMKNQPWPTFLPGESSGVAAAPPSSTTALLQLYLYLFWCWSLTCTLLTYNACKYCHFSMDKCPHVHVPLKVPRALRSNNSCTKFTQNPQKIY
jgi:hypothetical protein